MCGLVLGAGSAHAATQSYSGLFSLDDERALMSFTVATPGAVTMQTWSFGGGIDGAGNAVAAGGFAPVLSLFDATDALIGVAQAGVAGCGDGNVDSSSGYCWDVSWSGVLGAGSYLAVLTQDDNSPTGPFLSDGFLRDGQGNFTGPNFLGVAGSFILVDGAQRDGHWALDVTTPIPEPEPWAVLLAGLGLIGLRTLPGSNRARLTD